MVEKPLNIDLIAIPSDFSYKLTEDLSHDAKYQAFIIHTAISNQTLNY